MRLKNIAKSAFFAAALLLICASVASAQTQQKQDSTRKSSQAQQAEANQPGPDVTKRPNKARVLLDKIDVVGSLAKPQAIFIIPGTDPKVDGIMVDRSFFAEIFRPVEKDFFPQKGRKKFRGAIPW